jgi:hypothetical protein
VGIGYRFDTRLRCAFIVWDGDVGPEQWRIHVDAIVDDPAFPPGPLMLADLSTAGGVPRITTDIIQEMAERWRAHASDLDKMQWAIVPNGAWDKARRFESELEGSGLRTMVFNEPWTACSWLGLDADVVRPILRDIREQLRA